MILLFLVRVAKWPTIWERAVHLLLLCVSFVNVFSVCLCVCVCMYVRASFPFGFKGRVLDFIALFPDYFLSFNFDYN